MSSPSLRDAAASLVHAIERNAVPGADLMMRPGFNTEYSSFKLAKDAHARLVIEGAVRAFLGTALSVPHLPALDMRLAIGFKDPDLGTDTFILRACGMEMINQPLDQLADLMGRFEERLGAIPLSDMPNERWLGRVEAMPYAGSSIHFVEAGDAETAETIFKAVLRLTGIAPATGLRGVMSAPLEDGSKLATA